MTKTKMFGLLCALALAAYAAASTSVAEEPIGVVLGEFWTAADVEARATDAGCPTTGAYCDSIIPLAEAVIDELGKVCVDGDPTGSTQCTTGVLPSSEEVSNLWVECAREHAGTPFETCVCEAYEGNQPHDHVHSFYWCEDEGCDGDSITCHYGSRMR